MREIPLSEIPLGLEDVFMLKIKNFQVICYLKKIFLFHFLLLLSFGLFLNNSNALASFFF
jgi:hypothetical protein